MQYKTDEVLNEGKTKVVYRVEGKPKLVVLKAKDDITDGDGAKRDVIVGKGVLATTTACNVFRLLNECGVGTAFHEQISPTEFVSDNCEMIDLEVVVRREAHGSYCKRNPHIPKGHIFPRLLVEFFLKTSDKKWGDMDIPVDDPLIRFVTAYGKLSGFELYRPDRPIEGQNPFHTGEEFPFSFDPEALEKMEDMARTVFLVLEKAWALEEYRLVDFKIEFGFNTDRKLVLADVIDNDSWRIIKGGGYQDKQVYRDGGDLNEVTRKYATVAEATNHFRLPRQRIVLWTGSATDNKDPFIAAHEPYMHAHDCEMLYHMRSMHKEPMQGILELHQFVQGTFNSDTGVVRTIVIAYIGMSNGAGPTLAANTHIPVVTASPSVAEHPEDVWSSLRLPSNVPLATILSPKNATLSAIDYLADRSPRLYALRRKEIEERMVNVVPLA